MRPRPLSRFLPLTLALAAGCSEPAHPAGGRNLPGQTQAPETSALPAKADDGFIVGKRTQNIGKASPEAAKGAKVITNPVITAKDPITLQGNAYVTMVGKTSIMAIDQAMNFFKASNDRYPKDYEEFMDQVIKANNIALPALPKYQEYKYDEKEHKLVIYEYPNRKEPL